MGAHPDRWTRVTTIQSSSRDPPCSGQEPTRTASPAASPRKRYSSSENDLPARAAHWASGTTATPQGPVPALTRAISFLASRSTTDTSFDGPLAVYRILPSGESAIPHGRAPTLIVFNSS